MNKIQNDILAEKYIELVKNAVIGALDPNFIADFSMRDEKFMEAVQLAIPTTVRTMLGKRLLDNIQFCVKTIVSDNIEGDLFEAGCWKGGAVLFMKACLSAYDNESTKKIWCADRFNATPNHSLLYMRIFILKLFLKLGLVRSYRLKNAIANNLYSKFFPETNYDKATLDAFFGFIGSNSVSLQVKALNQTLINELSEVRETFARYNLLDDNVIFLEGWFSDTLPKAQPSINKLSLLRADADIYLSTKEIFNYLYSKLSDGGFCIVDDYGTWSGCRKAVDEFRESHQITDQIEWIDSGAIFWRKGAAV